MLASVERAMFDNWISTLVVVNLYKWMMIGMMSDDDEFERLEAEVPSQSQWRVPCCCCGLTAQTQRFLYTQPIRDIPVMIGGLD